MRVGVTLPTFRDDAAALDAARRAEDARARRCVRLRPPVADGPPRPPGPVGVSCPRCGVRRHRAHRRSAPLVARIGLVPEDVLVAEFASLAHMAPGRVIAGLGTGDSNSAAENAAFGIPFAPRRRPPSGAGVVRAAGGGPGRARMGWGRIGGHHRARRRHRSVRSTCGRASPPRWPPWRALRGHLGGPVPGDVAQIAMWLSELARAGCSWAVCAWPESVEAVAEAAAPDSRSGK